MRKPISLAFALVVLLVAACSPAGGTGGATNSGQTSSSGQQSTTAPTKKSITVAVRGQAPVIWSNAFGLGAVPEWIIDLVNSDPIAFNPPGDTTAVLAEKVPNLDDGSWKLLPDGTMTTTVTVRQGAKWHDGMPITADDLVFGVTVGRDLPELEQSANYGPALFKNLEKVEAVDDRTVVATWSAPYAQADWLFSYLFAPPMPKHILGDAYTNDKASFTGLPDWSTQFVGSGPFMVQQYNPGIELDAVAFDDYVLGRPKIDHVKVLYILDANALIANLLAGTVDLTLGQGLSVDQGLHAQESWNDGMMIYSQYFLTQAVGYPQFQNPDPAIQLNVQFRRALAYATDRDSLVQSIGDGVGGASSALIAPTGPDYDAIKSQIVDYPYDTQKATQMIEDLGYTKGGDGMFHDASGQLLSVPVWTTAGDDVYERTNLAVADMWHTLGIDTPQNVVPPTADISTMPSRPGFQMAALRTEVDTRFLSSEVPTAANNWKGGNRAGYGSPDLDSLLNNYFQAVPKDQHQQLLGQIVHYLGDQVVVLHLFYNPTPQLMNKRLQNVTPRTSRSNAWNAQLWDVTN